MENHILKFCHYLRKAGIRVSASEVQDCLQALQRTGLSKPVFYQVLRSTLVKEQAHFKIFNRLLELYFKRSRLEEAFGIEGPCLNLRDSDNGGMERPAVNECSASQGNCRGFGGSGSMERLVQIIKVGREEDYEAFVREGINSLGPLSESELDNIEETTRRIRVYLDWNMAVNKLQKDAEREGQDLWWLWQERLSKLEEALQHNLDIEFLNRLGDKVLSTVVERENLNELDFYKLSEDQIAEMRKKVTRLGHQLATRVSFRRARAKKGSIDLPRTIRRSMNTGGVPINPAYRHQVPSRPEFWVFCDVSGSVKCFSEFMLQLTYSIQSRFLQVRSFVFVDTIAEATDCFRKMEATEAIREVYNKLQFSKTGFSDYGAVFCELYNRYASEMSKKVNILIIGDARNNYKPHQSEYLQRVKSLVKRVIWLNPEGAEYWGAEDSILSDYAQYCSSVHECRNLTQLARVARGVIQA